MISIYVKNESKNTLFYGLMMQKLIMKTKKHDVKAGFDTVKTFRKIKEDISKDLNGLSFDEIKEYLRKNSLKLQEEK